MLKILHISDAQTVDLDRLVDREKPLETKAYKSEKSSLKKNTNNPRLSKNYCFSS